MIALKQLGFNLNVLNDLRSQLKFFCVGKQPLILRYVENWDIDNKFHSQVRNLEGRQPGNQTASRTLKKNFVKVPKDISLPAGLRSGETQGVGYFLVDSESDA